MNFPDVLDVLGEPFVRHRAQKHVRSKTCRELIAIALREWLRRIGTKMLFITPASAREKDYCKSFNSKLRYEFLAPEVFFDLRKATALIEGWQYYDKTARLNAPSEYNPTAEVILPAAITLHHHAEVSAPPLIRGDRLTKQDGGPLNGTDQKDLLR